MWRPRISVRAPGPVRAGGRPRRAPAPPPRPARAGRARGGHGPRAVPARPARLRAARGGPDAPTAPVRFAIRDARMLLRDVVADPAHVSVLAVADAELGGLVESIRGPRPDYLR